MNEKSRILLTDFLTYFSGDASIIHESIHIDYLFEDKNYEDLQYIELNIEEFKRDILDVVCEAISIIKKLGTKCQVRLVIYLDSDVEELMAPPENWENVCDVLADISPELYLHRPDLQSMSHPFTESDHSYALDFFNDSIRCQDEFNIRYHKLINIRLKSQSKESSIPFYHYIVIEWCSE